MPIAKAVVNPTAPVPVVTATPASAPVAASPAETGLPAASAPVIASSPVAASTPQIDPPLPPASAPVVASAPVQASAPVAASTPVVQIDVYGDDAMAGFTANSLGMASVVTPNEPAGLQSLLRTQFNDTGITVVNRATGGEASSLMNEINGMDGGGVPTAQRIADSAVIDIENHAIWDAMAGETVSDYSGFLGQWIQDVRAAGKIPVLEEPNPVCDENHPQLGDYVTAMDDAARQYGVAIVHQYAYISALPNWQSHLANCFYPDAYLDALKAKQEQAVIAPIVSKLVGGQS